MKKIITFFLLLFLLTGCDYKELSEISISTVLGIDKEKDIYTISSLIVGTEENETLLYKGQGKSVTTALSNLNLNLSEDLYLNHVQTVLVSESLAKEGLGPLLDYFIKNDAIQNNFYLFLTQNTSAEEVLKTLLEKNDKNYNSITNIFKYNDAITYWDQTDSITAFLDSLLKKGKEPTLHSITVKEDTVKSSDLGIFKKDKLQSFSKNIMGIALLSGKANHIILNIPCGKESAVVKVKNIKLKTKTNGNIIQNQFKGTVSIQENRCNTHFQNNKKQVLSEVRKEMNHLLEKTIREVQSTDSDIFGYGNIFYQRKKPLKDSYFTHLKIENQIQIEMSKENQKEVYHE